MGRMPPELGMILILLLAPLVVLFLHAVLARLRRNAPPQKVAFHASLGGAVPVFFLLWESVFRHAGPLATYALDVIYCVIVYSALSYIYFHFYNMSETARRIRILCEIEQSGSVSPEELTSLYRTTDVVSVRLRRLVSLNQLHEEDGVYSIKGRTLYWAGMAILFWRTVLGLDRTRDKP